jgi:hypothetical protein
MKTFTRLLALAAMLAVNSTAFSASAPPKPVVPKPAPLPKEDRHAVEISFGSIGGDMDSVAYRSLRKTIDQALAKKIINITIYTFDNVGGFSGCVDDNYPNTPPSKDFEAFVKQLSTLKVAEGTAFAYKRSKSCSPLPIVANKPATVQVAMPDDSVYCDSNSGISLTDMQTELADIVVYSAAKKLPIAIENAGECGSETGAYNVYEIAASDLEVAQALGFTLWSEITAFARNP